MAGHIQDRWYKTETDTNGKTVRVKSDRHGTGLRYRARYGPDGSEKSKSFPDRQKRLAEKWLSAIETDMTRGQYTDPKSMQITFRQYADKWLDTKTPSVMTRKELGRRLRLHAYPVLGSRPIGTFRPEHIREFVAALEAKPGVAPPTPGTSSRTFRRSCPPLSTTRCCPVTRAVRGLGLSGALSLTCIPLSRGRPTRCSPFVRPFWIGTKRWSTSGLDAACAR